MYYDAYLSRDGKHVLAEFPDCPGCQTFGSDDTIFELAAEALEGWLEAHLVDGQTPPRPRAHYAAPAGMSLVKIPIRPGLAAAMNIRWARSDAGLSQKVLGELASVSQQQIAKLEDPDENPSLETLAKVGRALGLHVSVHFEPLEHPTSNGLHNFRAGEARPTTYRQKRGTVQAREEMRREFLDAARRHPNLEERDTAQYWTFVRRGRDQKGPFLVISKPGRTVVHIKNVQPAHDRWTFITASDPKKVGATWEIRMEGNLDECREAFYEGFKVVVNAP